MHAARAFEASARAAPAASSSRASLGARRAGAPARRGRVPAPPHRARLASRRHLTLARASPEKPGDGGGDEDEASTAGQGARAPRPLDGDRADAADDAPDRVVDASSSPSSPPTPAPPPQAMDMSALASDPNSSIDPDLDVVPAEPVPEDEAFALQKKRLELVIEEKEWRLEEPGDKMEKIIEYVSAVEDYKELCAARVPDTVSDLLSQYVEVHVISPGAPGYEDAFEFLCMGDDDDEDEEEDEEDEDEDAASGRKKNSAASAASPGSASDAARPKGFGAPIPRSKRHTIDIDEVDQIIRAFAEDLEDEADSDSDDDSDDDFDDGSFDEDEADLAEEAWRLLRGAAKEGPGPLHCARDVEGRWRWLEDDLGRPLERKPRGEFATTLMSVEEMVRKGLNVNSLHEEVDPSELVDFAGCSSWDDAIRVGREVEAALEHMQADGWEVDTRSWCNEAEALMVVKELPPLRTMSYVEGKVAAKKKKTPQAAAENKKSAEGEPAETQRLRGDNNVVNNNGRSGEKKLDDESLAA